MPDPSFRFANTAALSASKNRYNGSLLKLQGCSFETRQVRLLSFTMLSFHVVLSHHLTSRETVSVNPTPAATASANPTTTNLASSNTNRSNRTEVIGVAAGLGSFIVAVMVLGFSLWKWYHPRRSSNNGRPHDNLFEDSSDSYQLDASSAEAGTVTSDSQLTTATRPVVSESLATENSLMRR